MLSRIRPADQLESHFKISFVDHLFDKNRSLNSLHISACKELQLFNCHMFSRTNTKDQYSYLEVIFKEFTLKRMISSDKVIYRMFYKAF